MPTIARGVVVSEILVAAIDAREHMRDRDELERAAHREALVGPMREGPAASGIEDAHAEPSAMTPFESSERSRPILAQSSASRCGREQARDDERTTRQHEGPRRDVDQRNAKSTRFGTPLSSMPAAVSLGVTRKRRLAGIFWSSR